MTTTHISSYEELDEAITSGNAEILRDSLGASPLSNEEDLRRLMGGRPSLGASHAQGNGRSPVIQFSLPAEYVERLDQYAAKHGMKRAEVAREAVHRMLASA